MKEITRIHLAKVAYDIELDAKKDVQAYIHALERYADDPDLLGDIEIRMTELLAERGVMAGGVITADDVAAIRAQLGEPSDFASEDSADDHSETATMPERRMYRDEDAALAGGVLAGAAKYLSIDVVWVRLAFVILLFASFGTAIIVYFILWIIVPPARTAAEKLQMDGRPVTLASIKELAANDDTRRERSRVFGQIMSTIGGVLLSLLAIGSMATVAFVLAATVFGIGMESSPIVEWQLNESLWFMGMIGLFAVSGLLLSALCFVLANAVFRHQWNKRVTTAVIAIIAAGLVLFASGVGVALYGYTTEQARISALRKTTSTDLPAAFSNVKTLAVARTAGTEPSGHIEYIVSDTPRYEFEALPEFKAKVTLAGDAQSATVEIAKTGDSTWRPWDYMSQPVLRIYGPALDAMTVPTNSQTVRYYNEKPQAQIAVTLGDAAEVSLGGRYDVVNLTGTVGGRVSLEDAAIGTLSVDTVGQVTAGVVRSLNVKQPDICAAHEADYESRFVRVRAVSSGDFVYNGTKQPAQTIKNDCSRVVIGSEYNEEGEW